jgi:hypothetical protein
MKNHLFKFEDGKLTKRLVWKETGADAPIVEGSEGKESKEKEKTPGEILDAKTEFLRHLKLNEGKSIDLKIPNAMALRAALKIEVAKLQADEAMKKNLEQELMDGLMENVGAKGNETALNKFLQDRKVKTFKIEDGQWKFYTKDAKGKELPVSMQYTLDSVGTQDVEANVSQGVKEKREAEEKVKKEAKAADTKLLEEGEKINSVPQSVGELVQADFFEKMALSAGFKGKELAQQLKQKFIGYMDAAVSGGKVAPDLMKNSEGLPIYSVDMNEADKLKGASELLAKMGVSEMSLKEGALVYKKAGNEVSELFSGAPAVYVSEKAQQKGVEKKEKSEQKEKQAEEIKKNQGVEKPGREPALEKAILDKIKEPLNYRYVEAIKALFYYKGGEVRFSLPAADDSPMNCVFKENPKKKGDYILTHGSKGRMDLRGNGANLEKTLLFLIKKINSGALAQESQGNNLRSESKFVREGFDNIDSGPEGVDQDDIEELAEAGHAINANTQKMELDWEARGTDPMVYMTAGRHGKIEVIVQKDDIGGKGVDFYKFTADNFQDMARRLGSLRKWREPTENDQERGQWNMLEKTRRHLESEQFTNVLAGLGQLEGVKFPLQQTLEVRYGWLTKQKANEAFIITAQPLADGFKYAVKMKSGGNVMFEAATLEDLKKNLIEEKAVLSTVGGEQERNKGVSDLLETTQGGPYKLSEGVKVYGYRGNKLELAWGENKVPYQFEMPGEMAKAKEMGLVYVEGEQKVKPYEGAKLSEQTFSGGLRVEGKTGPEISEVAKKEIDATAKKIVDPAKRQQFVDFMNGSFNKDIADKKVKIAIALNLAMMAGEMPKKSEVPSTEKPKELDDYITKQLRLINSNKEKKGIGSDLLTRLDRSVQDSLSKLPRSQKMVSNLLTTIERIKLTNSNNRPIEAVNKFADDYKNFLNSELKTILTENDGKDAKLKDQKVIEAIYKLKDIAAFAKEWSANYDQFAKKEEQAKKSYESQDRVEAGKPHRGKLKELIAKEDVGTADDLRYKAVQLLSGESVAKKTSALKYDPELSNVLDNNLNNFNSVYLNITVGGRDYTLGLIRKNNGVVSYTLADGKNNPAKFGAGLGRAIEFDANSKPAKTDELNKVKGDPVLLMVNRLEAVKS